jgi:superfamily II RNA helicase
MLSPQVIYCPKNVQLICLSATVANAEELAGWIGQVNFCL